MLHVHYTHSCSARQRGYTMGGQDAPAWEARLGGAPAARAAGFPRCARAGRMALEYPDPAPSCVVPALRIGTTEVHLRGVGVSVDEFNRCATLRAGIRAILRDAPGDNEHSQGLRVIACQLDRYVNGGTWSSLHLQTFLLAFFRHSYLPFYQDFYGDQRRKAGMFPFTRCSCAANPLRFSATGLKQAKQHGVAVKEKPRGERSGASQARGP